MGAYAGCNPVVCCLAREARKPHVRGQRDGRDKGTEETKGFEFIILHSSLAMRVLDVVEVLGVLEFLRPCTARMVLTRLGASLPSQGA